MSRTYRPLSLRREALLFFSVAISLLVAIAALNLLVYRGAVLDMEAERLEEARALVAAAATRFAARPPGGIGGLERLVPTALAAAVTDAEGNIVYQYGVLTPLRPQMPSATSEIIAIGPSSGTTGVVSALAPLALDSGSFFIQIDFAADRLASHTRTLSRIVALNVVVLGTLTVLVLLFTRRLLRPWDSLLAQARQMDRTPSAGVDEVDFLVSTFEQALVTLDQRVETDDIALLGRTLAPSLQSGFMLLDSSGGVLSLNQLGATILDLEPPAVGTALEEVVAGDLAELGAILRRIVDSGQPSRRIECPIGPAGKRSTLGLTAHPLRRDDGATRGFIVLFTDLTRVREDARHDQISRSLSQLGEIAAGVAHEMRNGLGTLKGYLSLIEHSPDDESIRDYVGEMRAESGHLERVLTDFLSFARPGTLQIQQIDLADIVSRAVADPSIAGAAFEVELEQAESPMTGDALLIDRALRNLLQNAVDAQRLSGSEEPIAVRLRHEDATAVIEIEDRGGGLPPGIEDSIFQPFVSGRPDGVGLGLALAYRIADLHGGRLELKNRQTSGARATMVLPLKHAQADEPTDPDRDTGGPYVPAGM